MSLNHKPPVLSTGTFSIFIYVISLIFVPKGNFTSAQEKHLTFHRGHDRVSTIRKGCDEDGPEPYPSRELPAGERQQDASLRPITSEPESRRFLEVFPGAPVTGIGFAGT